MKSFRNLILLSTFSLHFLSMSYGESCKSKSCSSSGPSIQYPFRIKDVQLKSCGSPGFDVCCDYGSSKTLLELPSAGNFSVDNIYYYIREIDLSDPDNCLPQKLMSLDLNKISPFLKRGEYQGFQLYNCSGDLTNFNEYDQIPCLSTSDYTVISVAINISVLDSNCTFVKTISAPSSAFYVSQLSYVSSILLTWNETNCISCDSPESGSNVGATLAKTFGALGLGLPALIIIIVCLWRNYKEQDSQSGNNSSSSRRINEASWEEREMRNVTAGLDQITIDSYPVVVIGESRRLIMPDDGTCPICLSDYAPHDMLKMLPECLHRFHAHCIDQWLRSKAVCPICRISPPRS